MFFNNTTHYTFTTGGFGITLNALGTDASGRNYTQCYTIAGAKLYVYIDEKGAPTIYNIQNDGSMDGETTDDLIVRKYACAYDLQCYPTHFSSSDKRYVYAAIPRQASADQTAVIVYPDRLIDVLGCYADAAEQPVQYGDPSYYYINLHGVITDAYTDMRRWDPEIVQGAILGHIVGDEAASTRAISTEQDMYRALMAQIERNNYFEKRNVAEREPVYVVDEDGNVVLNPETGQPMIEQVQEVDEYGSPLFIDEMGEKTLLDTGVPSMVDKYIEHDAIFLKDKYDYLSASVLEVLKLKIGEKPITDLQLSTDPIPVVKDGEVIVPDENAEPAPQAEEADMSAEGEEPERKPFPIEKDQVVPSLGYVHKALLSRLDDDTAAGLITFLKGLITKGDVESSPFMTGLLGEGWKLWANGHGEMDSLSLRKFLEVPELRFNRVSVHTGVDWQTFGGGIIEEVKILSDTTGMIKLKLEDGEYGAVAVDDKCQGVYHNFDGNNSTEERDDRNGNFEFKGFQTIYFRVTALCDADGNTANPDSRNQYFLYELRPASADWQGFSAGKNFHPQPAMHFAAYANKTNEERQACIYSTTRYTVFLAGMTEWTYGGSNIALVFGWLDGFEIASVDKDGNEYQKELTGMGFGTGRIYMWGNIEQFDRKKFIISQQIHLMATADDIDTVRGHNEVDEDGNPTENHWKHYYPWSAQQVMPTKEAPYLYQYWTYTYDDGSTEDTDPFVFGSFAEPQRRYYLETSVSSVVLDEMQHYSEYAITCRQMIQDGQDLPVETEDLIITMSIDGADEITYQPLVLADIRPVSSVKYFLKDADGVLYDTKSVSIVTDGTSSARILFSQDLIPLECSNSGWGDNMTEEADGFYYLSKDFLVKNSFYVLSGSKQRTVKEGSVSITFDPVQPLDDADATVTDISITTGYVAFRLLRDKFRTDRNTLVTVTLRYDDGTAQGAEVSGSFQITYTKAGKNGNDALSGKGAALFPVRWESVINTDFEFQSGQLGDKFIHMVMFGSLWYECIDNVTTAVLRATGLTPATDAQHFRAANNFEAVATRLLLAEKGFVDNLGVRFLQTFTGPGDASCTIDGDTGKLTARGASIKGHIEAESGSIGGFDLGVGEHKLINRNYDASIEISDEYYTQVAKIGRSATDEVTGKSCSLQAESTSRDQYNTALFLKAQGGLYNYAFHGIGNGVLNGYVMGYKCKEIILTQSSTALKLGDGKNQIITGKSVSGHADVLLPTLGEIRQVIGLNPNDNDTDFAVELFISNSTYVRDSGSFDVRGDDHAFTAQITDPNARPRVLRSNKTPKVTVDNGEQTLFVITYINRRFTAPYILY